ncbi:fimbrillin family protein [Alistipes sp.]|uniref:fimbrillin family protein n=1 Tax=Alistipes sp. TaxID=1872444 RepID=UPI003AEF8B3D
MRITFWKMLAVLPLLIASCSQRAEEDAQPDAKTIRVTVASGPRIEIASQAVTRSEIDEEGITVKWNTDDRIALWAEHTGGGTFALSAHEFALYHYNADWNAAKFTADIPQMEAGTYNYYAVSPRPAAVDGTRASFDIPAVQDGSRKIPCLVMVADPVAGAEALAEGDNSDIISLHFTHKVHVLKISIPRNDLNEPVSELQLTFPQPVVGRLTVDAADPEAESVLTGGSNTLTLRFAEPKNAGDVVFAAIRPLDIPEDQPIEIVALGQTCESKTASFAGKDFRPGRTTPIDYNVPAAGRLFTRLRFALPAEKGTATLGEAVTRIKLTAPADATFGNDSNTLEFRPDANGTHTIMLKPSWEDRLSGREVEVEYESESAVVRKSVKFDAVEAWSTENKQELAVPYLLEENFDTVTTFSDGEGATGANNDPAAIWIPGLSGWSAARAGGQAGKSVRIAGHREGGLWVYADYEARMDSAPLAGIKAGKSVNVRINFDYSGSTNKGAPKLKYGTSTAAGLQNGANADIESQAGNITANTNGSYTNVNQKITPFTATGRNNTRLSWVAYGSDGGFSGSYFYYIYIDNVKVSIAH